MERVITRRQAPFVDAEAVVERLACHDWAFDGADTLADGHGIHPYPAKFPPQVPRQVIEELTEPGDLVVDPFGGSGTTALESVRTGRRAFTIDANPVGVRLTRVKVGAVDPEGTGLLEQLMTTVRRELATPCGFSDELCPTLASTPSIPNRSKWFADSSVHELSHLRTLVGALTGSARDVAELALGQTAARVSFQESETRYVSRPREVARGEALRRFATELARMIDTVPRTLDSSRAPFQAVEGDARDGRNWRIDSGSAALVVTSPPYPNAYDYHLYHRFRMLWTGSEPTDLRRIEIGSHLRQQTVADPISDYEMDMRAVIANARTALRPGGWLVLVVGDGKYKGVIYPTSEAMARIGAEEGYEVGGVITRDLPATRRSVTVAGRRLQQEQLVFLRKPGAVVTAGPAWRMVDYEEDLGRRELDVLSARDPHDLTGLTFARSVSVDGRVQPTVQGMLEAADGTRRKNSTYATHGIHRYKGKFYPQLGRCLINLSSDTGALVVDPFSGSGTVGLESVLLGRRFHGIELSPVAAAIGTAKVGLLSTPSGVLQESSTAFGRRLAGSGGTTGLVPWEEFHPATHEELSSWFSFSVLSRIGKTLRVIRDAEAANPGWVAVGDAARVCLSDLIREVSHQDPSDLRIRRRKEPLLDAPVEEMFLGRWNELVRKVLAARSVVGEVTGSARIVQGDSTDPANWPTDASGSPEKVDAVVSSPPYAAALPYLDTDRLSMAAVFGNSRKTRAGLEAQLVGSREISTGDLRSWTDWLRTGAVSDLLPASTSSFLLALTDAVEADRDAGFRKQQTPAVLTRYFVAMSKVLAEVSAHLKPGGQAWYVLGDSRTTVGGQQWTIPTTQETAGIAKHHGLELVETIPITVTRENMRHAKNAITKNTLLHFQMP